MISSSTQFAIKAFGALFLCASAVGSSVPRDDTPPDISEHHTINSESFPGATISYKQVRKLIRLLESDTSLGLF
jgi:hypothetical protein